MEDFHNETGLEGACKYFSNSNQPLLNRLALAALILIPLSYVIYRITRTVSALLWSIYQYWIRPIFCSFNAKKLGNRWTVVTGATDGIGRAYTMELAKRGVRRFVLIGRNAAKLAAVKKELEFHYEDCMVRTELFDFLNGDFGRLRVALADVDVALAVNSVGVGREMLERFGDSPAQDTQLLRVNGLGSAEFLSCILPPMERNGGGQIVVLSSSQGIRPIPMLASYSATKSMLLFLCECINREYATINVQCLTPALVATKMTYYTRGSLFVVTAENFARQAVSVLGATSQTSGCFNHEIQLLLRHLFPWALLKYLIMPIYWLQHRRLVKLQKSENGQNMRINKQIVSEKIKTDENLNLNLALNFKLPVHTKSVISLKSIQPMSSNNCQLEYSNDKHNDYDKNNNSEEISNEWTCDTRDTITVTNSITINSHRTVSKIPTKYMLRHRA